MFNLTSLLEYVIALLEYIELFVIDVLNVFQHDYCIPNQGLYNTSEPELHPPYLLSYTLQ